MFALARPAALRYTTLAVRLSHFAIAALPGILLALAMNPARRYGFDQVLVLSLASALLCVLVSHMLGLYGTDMLSNRWLLGRTFLAWTVAFCLPLLVPLSVRRAVQMPRRWLAAWYLTSLVLLWAGRCMMLHALQRRVRREKFIRHSVICGMTSNGRRLADHMLARADAGAGLIGFIDDRQARYLPSHRLPLLGDIERLEALVRGGQVDQILLAMPASEPRYHEYVQRLRRLPVQVLAAPDLTLLPVSQQRMIPVEVAGAPMFVIAEPPLQGWAPLVKRCEDVVLSSLALLLLSPLMLLLALAIKLDSPGPVLFRQARYGYNHRLIGVYKFRSMHHHLRDEHADVQTGRHDPRVTRVGRFIRKTSLDELPQLFNVLNGSMSMVGPRPHATATKAANVLFEDAVEEYVARHRVKPGITGLAQVNGYRGETDTLEKIQRRVEYDLHYIENWSLWMDLSILLRTLPAVISARAAY